MNVEEQVFKNAEEEVKIASVFQLSLRIVRNPWSEMYFHSETRYIGKRAVCKVHGDHEQ